MNRRNFFKFMGSLLGLAALAPSKVLALAEKKEPICHLPKAAESFPAQIHPGGPTVSQWSLPKDWKGHNNLHPPTWNEVDERLARIFREKYEPINPVYVFHGEVE